MKIFVDDIRTPVSTGWVCARTVGSAQDLIAMSGGPFLLSLDHDLGGDSTTRELMTWMLWEGFVPAGACVHSANPVGHEWLTMCLKKDFSHPIPTIPTPDWV